MTSNPQYEIDDAGNLIEGGQEVQVPAPDGPPPVAPEQARRTLRALVFSELLGVLLLLGGAVYYEDERMLLLAVTAVYAVFAVFATRYLRNSIYKQVEEDSPV